MATKEELLKESISNEISVSQDLPSGNRSYADVTRTPPSSQPSNLRGLSTTNTSATYLTDTPFCTIDITRVTEEDRSRTQVGELRRAIEQEVRMKEGGENWRCAAVAKDPRNHNRIRITGRDEEEIQLMKEAATKTAVPGARVLRDQLHPVKVDNANRLGVLDAAGAVLAGAAEALGTENEVNIAKIAYSAGRTPTKHTSSPPQRQHSRYRHHPCLQYLPHLAKVRGIAPLAACYRCCFRRPPHRRLHRGPRLCGRHGRANARAWYSEDATHATPASSPFPVRRLPHRFCKEALTTGLKMTGSVAEG